MIFQTGLLAIAGMHHHLPPLQAWLKQRPFPTPGSAVRAILGTMASSDFSNGVAPDFALRLIPALTQDVAPATARNLPCCAIHSHDIPIPYAGEFFEAALPESSPLPWPSPRYDRLGSPC